jgi:hypothetical protein
MIAPDLLVCKTARPATQKTIGAKLLKNEHGVSEALQRKPEMGGPQEPAVKPDWLLEQGGFELPRPLAAVLANGAVSRFLSINLLTLENAD